MVKTYSKPHFITFENLEYVRFLKFPLNCFLLTFSLVCALLLLGCSCCLAGSSPETDSRGPCAGPCAGSSLYCVLLYCHHHPNWSLASLSQTRHNHNVPCASEVKPFQTGREGTEILAKNLQSKGTSWWVHEFKIRTLDLAYLYQSVTKHLSRAV